MKRKIDSIYLMGMGIAMALSSFSRFNNVFSVIGMILLVRVIMGLIVKE